jgi:gliding motility-associated-like protein
MKKLIIQGWLVILAFLPSKLMAQIPTNGLVAFYPFNGNAKDESGNNNDGDVLGSSLAPDRCSSPDSAYLFNGTDNYILIQNSPSLNFTNAITLCAWIKPVSLMGHGNSAIISKGYYSHTNPYYQYHLGITGDSYPNLPARFSVALSIYGNYEVLTGDSLWKPDRWYFVAGTYDGNGMKLYLNGVLIAQNSVTGPIDIYNEPVCIGRTRNYPGSAYTPGTIDDARIYNRALNASEIEALYYSNCNLRDLNGPMTVCQNQKDVNYFVLPISNADNYSWKYSGTGAILDENLNSVSVDFDSIATSGNLSVTVTGIDYPSQTSTIPVLVNKTPNGASIINGGNEVCLSQTDVIYQIPQISNAANYNWQYSGSGATITGTTNQVSVDFSETATNGQITVTGENSCGGGAPSPGFDITVIKPPSNAGIINGLNDVCQNIADVVYSVSEISDASSYQWQYSGEGVSIQGNSDHVSLYFFNNATSGNLSVSGTNSCGSGPSSDSFPITVKSCSENPGSLNIPNAFSPNGDGINDFFVIQGLSAQSHLIIFNRSGKKWYESENYLNDWDGKDSDGKVMETDTYWYVLIIPGIQNEFKGFVYLKK